MPASETTESKIAVNVCPECGSDVSVLRDTTRNWTHTSRMSASIIWLVIVLGLVGYWLFLGAWESTQTQINNRITLGSEFRFALAPWSMPTDSDFGFLSSDELIGTIDGDEDALNRVKDTLQLAVNDAVLTNQDKYGLLGIKYGLIEPAAYISSYADYTLGGDWVTMTTSDSILDVRNLDSMDSNRVFDWEDADWEFFPVLSYSKRSSDTTSGSTKNFVIQVDYLTILGVLSVCVIFVWVFHWTASRAGWNALGKRTIRIALIAAMFLLCTAVTMLTPQKQISRSSTTSIQSLISPAYSLDELGEIAQDSVQAIGWATEILSMYPEDQQEDMMLGQYRVFDQDLDTSVYEMGFERSEILIGNRFDLFTWGRASFQNGFPQSNLPKPHSIESKLRSLHYEGALVYIWGPPRSVSFVRIKIVHLALIGMTLYLFWVSLQLISLLIFKGVQRRRVRRDQCIFCAYPLTSEARIARNPPQAP